MKLLVINQNDSERIARFIISIFLIPAPFIYGYELFSVAQAVVGGILLFNSISGMGAIYRIFNANTCRY